MGLCGHECGTYMQKGKLLTSVLEEKTEGYVTERFFLLSDFTYEFHGENTCYHESKPVNLLSSFISNVWPLSMQPYGQCTFNIMSTRNISQDSILQFNHTQFHVASQSHPGTLYSIDLNLTTCNCQDFPRIQFYKHIAAIHLHFPHLCFEQSDPIMPLEYSLVPDQQKGNSNSNSNSTSESGSTSAPEATLLEKILTLTHKIILLPRKSTNHITWQLLKPSGLLNIV